MEILSKKETVKQLLVQYPGLRNSDNKLIARIWNDETFGIDSKWEFLAKLRNGQLTNPETIRRVRQKLQQEYPELRAVEEVTHGRKEEEKHVKDELNQI